MARYRKSIRLPVVAQVAAQVTDTKASNPKESFGDAKMPLGLVPDTAIIEESLAFLEGALKYGQYNWRVVGVKASTYNRAMERHRKKWWNGQDRDPVSMVLELASVRACCAIVIDSIAAGNFVDDRPPRANIERTLEEAAKIAKHLKELFKDHAPPQYTEREHGARQTLTTTDPEHFESVRAFNALNAARGIQGSGLAASVPAGTKRQRNRGVKAARKLYVNHPGKGFQPAPTSRAKLAKVLKVKSLPRGTRRFG